MLRCLLLLAAAASAEATTLRFLFTGVRNDNNNVGQSIDISLSEIVVYDAGSNALAVASISGHHNANHPNNEDPTALIDGSNLTKWIDLNFTNNGGESYVIMELEASQAQAGESKAQWVWPSASVSWGEMLKTMRSDEAKRAGRASSDAGGLPRQARVREVQQACWSSGRFSMNL